MVPCSVPKKSSHTPPPQVLISYVFFIVSAFAVWHLVAERAFSSILTISVMLQSLGVVLLALQVLVTDSVACISARALTLDLMALVCRLSSTMWLNGYLPVDKSGDHIFQFFDLLSVFGLLWILHQIWNVKRKTYDEKADTFPIAHMVMGAFILAALLHGNMNRRPIFDALWMVALFISAIAVLPQLWLITKTGGHISTLSCHHIAAVSCSRILSGVFMWYARADVTCSPWVSGYNHALGAILGAHIVQVIFICDFAYFYIKAILADGVNCRIEISDCGV